MRPFFFAVVALFAAFAEAQLTETIVDANAESVVIVVSTNTLLGVITTETLETLTGTTTATTNTRTRATTATTTATTATTTLAQGGGVVGAPATTTNDDPHGPTPYTYTTVIGGITTLIEDTFTPTFPATTPSTAPATGSIMAFSQYQSIYGTVSASSANSAAVVLVSQKALMGLVATTVVCLLGGVWTILP
ncbi:uncharacterized protein EV420DRAFT_1497849 [Desarmillaria tabescens]|uniref:Uncharacterized protein n=1 Tax=Armillaria tabescens TaxID=1929756 RepID=A0AA39TYF7_ARMTA|nr:uncharacterized protein EV420DRAFT_1497849 [Desarmillaria tabescens]KAK0469993.1 hypothetical protein EV420DRAFT_1497849 [Desarmillaria tabescens]